MVVVCRQPDLAEFRAVDVVSLIALSMRMPAAMNSSSDEFQPGRIDLGAGAGPALWGTPYPGGFTGFTIRRLCRLGPT
jgi:hypothetical protein